MEKNNCRLKSRCDAARRARPLRSANSLPLERRRMKNRAMRRPQCVLLRRKGGRPATVPTIGEASPGTLGRRHRLWGGGKQNKKPLFAAKRGQRKRQRQRKRGGCARNRLTNAQRPKQFEIVSKRLLLPSEIAFRPEPPQGRSAAFEEMGLGETRGHNPAPLSPST